MVLSIQNPLYLDHPAIPIRTNQLLNLLSESNLQNWLIYSERLIIPAKTNLYQPNEPIEQVYFPLLGIISFLNVSDDGLLAETAAVSNAGMVGIGGFLGDNIASVLAVTQTNCSAISLPINIFREKFAFGRELQRILLLYTQLMLTQLAQNVFCSCHHTLEQRLARWLLFYSDRLATNTLLLTQETLAELLGVRRSSLSAVAVVLRQRNLIDYNRGKIMILNGKSLRKLACDCDRLILAEYARLMNLAQA